MVNAILIDVPSWVLSSQPGLYTAKQGEQTTVYNYFMTGEDEKVNFYHFR
jgi:hypothetical protein